MVGCQDVPPEVSHSHEIATNPHEIHENHQKLHQYFTVRYRQIQDETVRDREDKHNSVQNHFFVCIFVEHVANLRIC